MNKEDSKAINGPESPELLTDDTHVAGNPWRELKPLVMHSLFRVHDWFVSIVLFDHVIKSFRATHDMLLALSALKSNLTHLVTFTILNQSRYTDIESNQLGGETAGGIAV